MRRFLIAVLVLVGSLTLGGYLFLQSPERVLRSLVWAVDTLTPLHLELRGPVLDTSQGHFQVDEILLFQDGGDRGQKAPLLAISGFDARTQLQDVLLERLRDAHLRARNVTIYVAAGDDTEDPTPAHWMRYLRWLPASLEVDSVHVITSGEQVRVIPLKAVTGKRLDERRYRLQVAADYEGEPLDVTLYLYALRDARGFRGLQLRGEFHATRSSRLAIVEGELRGGTEAFSYDVSLDAAFPDVRSLLAGFGQNLNVDGSLQVHGRVRGDIDGFTLSGAEFHLLNPPAYNFSARGDFRYDGPGETMLDLSAEGGMAQLGTLLDWIDLDLSSLGEAKAQMVLHGPLGALEVKRFELSTAHHDGLQVDVRGSLAPGALAGKAGSGDDRLQVSLKGPRLAVLRQWLGEPPVDPGPWAMTATLSGSTDALHASDIQATLGDANGLAVRASGEVGTIDLSTPITAASVDGVALDLALESASPALLNDWLGLSLPPDLALAGRARISGTGERLELSDGNARASGSDLDLVLAGLSGRLTGRATWQVEAVSGDLSLTLSDTSALSQYLDRAVPVLGEVRATARLGQQGEQFSLNDIHGIIDSDQLKLQATGRIDDLQALRGTRLELTFSRLDTRNLVHTLSDGFTYDKPLGQLAGSALVEQAGDQWNISQLAISNNDADGFGLEAKGALEDLTGVPHGDISLEAAIDNRELLEAVSGLALPGLHLSLRSRTGDNTMTITGDATLGQSRFSTRGEIRYLDNAITGLALDLRSPRVRLVDVGLQASEAPEDDERQAAPTQQSHPLESLIEILPDYPIDLGLHLSDIRGEQTHVQQLDVSITGENRQYLLRELNAIYDQARAEIRGLIDLKTSPPAISLGGQALAIDLTRLVRDLGISSDIQGILNVQGGVSARGNNADEWLRSLDGSVALALENAVIEGAAYDVLATDLLAWLYSGAALQKSTHIQCTMAQFALSSGVATTDSIFVESPRMIASGKGELDFVNGKLDVTLTPRSKDRLLEIPSSVTLHGDMSNPKTRISAIAATADASAEALMLIPKLTMKLFGIKLGKQAAAAQPCEASLVGPV